MRNRTKWIGLACLIPFVLILLISILLYIPPFQNFAVQFATQQISEATNMHVGIGKVRLSFPLNLNVQQVDVIQSADTLLSVDDFHVNIPLLPLLKGDITVNVLSLQGVKIDSKNLIDGMMIKGTLGEFYAQADHININKEIVQLNKVDLSDTALTLILNDSTKADTTSSSTNWRLEIDQMNLSHTAFAMQIPNDSLRLSSYIQQAGLKSGVIDLGESSYKVNQFFISHSSLNYDTGNTLPASGFDPSHITLSDIQIQLDSIRYKGKEIQALLRTGSAKERSGLSFNSLVGEIVSDSTVFQIPHLALQTPYSHLNLQANIPWSTIEETPQGNLLSTLSASIGKEDLFSFIGTLPEDFKQAYPNKPLKISTRIEGNISKLSLKEFKGELSQAFNFHLSGEMKAVTDSIRRSGELQINAQTEKLDFLLSLLPPNERSRYNIPFMSLNGKARLQNRTYHADFSLTEEQGEVKLNAYYQPKEERYQVNVSIDSLCPTNFLPQDSLYFLTACVQMKGKGLDPFLSSTSANIKGDISNIRYGNYSVSNIQLDGSLNNHLLQTTLTSQYPLAKMNLLLDATLYKEKINATLKANVEHFDLYGMHLMNDPLKTSFQLLAKAETDRSKNHLLNVSLDQWKLIVPNKTYSPKSLTLKANSEKDTTNVSFQSGDFNLTLNGTGDIGSIIDKLSQTGNLLTQQFIQDSTIHISAIRPLLPNLDLKIHAQKENPVYNLLQFYKLTFDQLNISANTSPEQGISFDANLLNFMQDTTRIDTINLNIHQDTVGLIYEAQAFKTPYRKQQPFSANIQGTIGHKSIETELRYYNGKGETGILLGARLDKEKEGLRLQLFPENPILAFRPFKLNTDNYILYRNIKNITGDIHLTGESNASLWIHSLNEEQDQKEILLELSQIDLALISKGFPNMPMMKGIFNADVRYVPSDSSFMVVTDSHIDSLFYEEKRVGELMLNAVYLPINKKEHQVDVHLFRDQNEITAVNAYYSSDPNNYIEGDLNITDLPLEMLTPFIPDNMAKLNGMLQGELSIIGHPTSPDINGFIQMDSSSVYVTAAGTTIFLDQQPVKIKDNFINFNNYQIHTSGKNPFVINGTIDMQKPSLMIADLKLTAQEMELLNVKRNKESMVYGKLFVNLNSTVKGPLESLTMRGDLQLLGGTDVTYVMQESSLAVQDRLSGLVTFTDFSDTLQTQHKRPTTPLPIGGLDMLMTIRIDQSVRINADITPDQSSRIELEGGGDLSFQYTKQGDMILNGRYMLSGGMVKYAMPIIPLKEFNIQEGSYVQWNGDAMNPTLNITATERVRAAVSQNDGSSRQVTFNVGVAIKQSLENLDLQFILSAPEDQSMQQELNRMGEEQQSQIAVTMLVTGMYLNINEAGNSNKKSNLNMGAALNSFLQSEINNIAGSALKSVDISLGMEQYDQNGTGSGGQRTDFSFRFAKRFYNDRISIILGGRVSTGKDVNTKQSQQFIDNVSIEYRLDNSGTRYIKLFHNKNYESLLEGEIIETGAGIVLRKKMLRLRELFIFKKKKIKPVTEDKEEPKSK